MKTLTKKNRTQIQNLPEREGSAEHVALSHDQLRLIAGGLPMRMIQASSCTQCCDEDCD